MGKGDMLTRSISETIVNFYFNIFGFSRLNIKKNQYKPIINLYDGNIMVYTG